jgi:hypothetical protein
MVQNTATAMKYRPRKKLMMNTSAKNNCLFVYSPPITAPLFCATCHLQIYQGGALPCKQQTEIPTSLTATRRYPGKRAFLRNKKNRA